MITRKSFFLSLVLINLCFLGCNNKIPAEWENVPKESGISVNENPKYQRKADGFFSLIEDGNATPLKTQKGGTCWLNGIKLS